MATTVEEMVIRARPDGVGDVQEAFGAVKEQFGVLGDLVDNISGLFGGFVKNFAGVLSSILGGIGLAVGGLLTQVPVVRELFGGLAAVVQALGLAIDKKLRPILRPLIADLYELSGAIADGDWGEVKAIFAGWYNSLKSFDFSAIFATIKDVFFRALDAIRNITGGIDILGLLNSLKNKLINVAGKVDWKGLIKTILDKLGTFINETDWSGIADKFVTAFEDAVTFLLKNVDWSTWFKYIKNGLKSWIDSVDWSEVAKGIGLGVAGAIADLPSGSDLAAASDNGNITAADAAAAGGFRANRGGGTTINMDGRDVTEDTGRFRLDETTRRGL